MDNELKKGFYLLIIALIFSSVLETLSIALIFPILKFLIDPQYLRNLVEIYFPLIDIKNFSNSFLITISILIVIFVFALKNLIIFSIIFYQTSYIKKFITNVTKKIFQNYLNLDYFLYKKKNHSSIIKTLDHDSVVLFNNLTNCAALISEFFFIFLICSLLLVLSPKAMLITVSFFIIGSGSFLLITKKKIKIWGKEKNIASVKKISSIKEMINSIRELKLYDLRNFFTKEFSLINFHYFNIHRKQNLIYNLPKLWIEIITVVAIFILIYILIIFGGKKINIIEILPLLGLYVGSSFKLIPSFNKIIMSLQSLRFIQPILNEYNNEYYLKNTKQKDHFEKINFGQSIIFKDLNFSYDQKPLIKNIHLEIKKGSKYGFFGKSGSGKSTFLDIVSGLIEPNSGQIIVDNKLVNLNSFSWRKKINYASQNSILLNSNLKDNVILNAEFDKQKYLESLKLAGLPNLDEKKIFDENFIIGENSQRISGGEKQRIILARLFYMNREILILDEATSALDKETEKDVLSNIFKYFKNSTVLIVSHDKEILESCDQIISFEDLIKR